MSPAAPGVGAPGISVIVPVHEDREGLRRCLAALRAQDVDPGRFEVVVCDNASRQHPVSAEDLTGPELPRVVLLTSGVPGSYGARNRCLEVAAGTVLAFTDADCTPHPDWLSAGTAALEEQGADLVAGRVDTYTTHQPPTPMELWERENAFPQRRYVEEMGFGVTANLFVRRPVFDAVGPFDERLRSGGDRELCTRAAAAGHRLVYGRSAAVDHPARATVAEVAHKARRVLAGARDDGRLGPARSLVRGLRPPLGAARRALASPRLTSRRERVGYVVGEVTAHYVRWFAEVQVRLRRG